MSQIDPKPRVLSGGPKALFWIGLVLLVVGIAVAIAGVITTVRSAPLDVITMSGEPGSGVVAVADAPGSAAANLEAGVEYSFLLVEAKNSKRTELDGAIVVTGPDGAPVDVVSGSSAGFSISGGDRSGRTIGAVQATAAGVHTVVVPPGDPAGAQVFVTQLPSTSSFAIGLFGGVAGIIIGAFVGSTGFFMLIGGLIWGMVRSSSAQRR